MIERARHANPTRLTSLRSVHFTPHRVPLSHARPLALEQHDSSGLLTFELLDAPGLAVICPAPAPSSSSPTRRAFDATTGTLSRPQASSTNGLSVVTHLPPTPSASHSASDSDSARPPYSASASINAVLTTTGESLQPPPFSSLFFAPGHPHDARNKPFGTTEDESPPAFASAPPFTESSSSASAAATAAATKAALPRDTKDASSRKDVDDGEPPPPYSEGSSPLESFAYVMASAGGPASIITQVSQTSAGPPINTLGGSDENITLELRGSRFTLSRDELLTLPEFVLLSLFPNGLLPDGHMNSYHDGDVYPVDYDPNSLQYMLEFFRTVAQTIPASPPSPTASTEHTAEAVPIEPMHGSARDMLQDRAGIIVLREDLDFYAIPPHRDITQPEMIEVKRAAGEALLEQNGIFSGLRKSEEPGTTEQHLIEMLTAGGFNHDDRWGHRAGEPNKAVICSIALARLRTDIKGNDLANSNAVGMAQKLLLFWRKPARRCWWEGVELENVRGVEGKLKVWIRRVWTLEMSVIGLR
ncbi:hypothetical protein NX059_006762 [Plenodomus lindquistii]|nr:hypothetical protein NX059_006762 [Plenodomus lindquistii]